MEELTDDIVGEILLRFPPTDPASLVRAALVCKPWCRVVCGRSFRRRFMEFHRVAPLLGFLHNPLNARFVPTSSLRPPHAADLIALLDCEGWDEEELWQRDCVALDARHGLVLLYFDLGDDYNNLFLVWDPTTDERWEIRDICCGDRAEWHATVLCASTANGHLDYHDTPFVVVVVTRSHILRWCSRDASWSKEPLLPRCSADLAPTALVGNTLYFLTNSAAGVLSFDLATRVTSVISLPPKASECATVLMAMEDGGLGFARLDMAARLSLWSMEANPNGDMGWTQTRVIELEKLLPVNADSICCDFLGFAHVVGVFLVGTYDDGLFSFDLKSGQVKKVYEELCDEYGNFGRHPCVVPYTGFCTPGYHRY